MSARKSFDLEGKRPAKRKVAARKTKRSEPTPRRKKSLREKREEERTLLKTGIAIGCLALAGVLVYALWRPEIRISRVDAGEGVQAEAIESIATAQLAGAYYHIVPRDSFFFYPERAIAAQVFAAYPAVSKVEVSREGFDALQISVTTRKSAFVWCGTPEAAPASTECYDTDADGLVFARAALSTTTETLRVYAALEASTTDAYPLRARVVGASSLRSVLKFVENVRALSVPIHALSLRGDEADLFAPEGTRITYVIGHEREAAQSAVAAFPKLNFMDGSLAYVDLRFPGKAYVKRVGE